MTDARSPAASSDPPSPGTLVPIGAPLNTEQPGPQRLGDKQSRTEPAGAEEPVADRSGTGQAGTGRSAAVTSPSGESLATLLHGYRVHARAPRRVVAALSERPRTLRQLVQDTGLPRRSVEAILHALGEDLRTVADGRQVLRAETIDHYRSMIGYEELHAATMIDPLAAEIQRHGALVTQMHSLIAAAPRPRADLDHVPATAATAVRRAVWLWTHYDLREARLLCVGDHDLTSLALLLLAAHGGHRDLNATPRGAGGAEFPTVTVVDIDENLLAFLDQTARAHALPLHCLYADLRLGLPPSLAGQADLVFTDPPYTPAGMSLFAARGAQGLADRERGRVLIAYGYSERAPALGARVQRALLDQGFAFEAILPDFHVYEGAEAIGARADMYVCQPTAATWKRLERLDRPDRPADRDAGGASGQLRSIYTRGRHAEESEAAELAAPVVAAARRFLAAAPGRGVFIGDRPLLDAATHTRLPTVLDRGLPPSATSGATAATSRVGGPGAPGGPTASSASGSGETSGFGGNSQTAAGAAGVGRASRSVVADLADDPGPWLLRVLLAVNADRLGLLVDADHPDLSTRGDPGHDDHPFGLVRAKWVRTPGLDETPPDAGRTRLLAVAAVDPSTLAPPARLARWLLDRAHGRLGNVWRDGLIRAARDLNGEPLPQRAALAAVHTALGATVAGSTAVGGTAVGGTAAGAARATGAAVRTDLDPLAARLIDLPRHTVATVLAAAAASVERLPGARS
ncbi:putative methyltransferase [Frankia sp. AiPs1]|uniref:bis-aminopropyl spermidine synthase family protein n=1 Tax=Frankia sp. AiPa1 TaxID=573492 RepID=UPI00202B06D4|nr:bis-aminopropyl spermidine synthase family protein [Frankia sp. AiPa1]MCL9760662.1 bis-aminopropyl spermidine synthase family protein [Frankia sp. AiPa1]